MTQPLEHPRLRELVSNVRRAVAMRDTVLSEGGDATAIDEVLLDLYRDVGKMLVGLLVEERVAAPTKGDDMPEADEDSWYTDEVETKDARPLFAPEDLDESTDVPEPEPVSPEDATPSRPLPDLEVATIEVLARAGELAPPSDPDAVPTWRFRLDQLLELLALPAHLEDPAELAVEASRVQWITTELEPRLDGFPAEVQVALVGLLAARAQHLRRGASSDVGPRLSLDRLQRYRIEADLPTVAGLLPTPRPEGDSWESDIRGWWELLQRPVTS